MRYLPSVDAGYLDILSGELIVMDLMTDFFDQHLHHLHSSCYLRGVEVLLRLGLALGVFLKVDLLQVMWNLEEL